MKKRQSKHTFKALERFVDKAVPWVLVALAIVIVLDNPLFTLFNLENYEIPVLVFDTLVIIFLVADLIFKWFHIRNLKVFVKHYWLELIAVFPFYLVFRIYIFAAEFARAGEEAQRIFHEAILTRETRLLKEARFVQEAEKVIRESRPFVRFMRSAARFIRLLGARFYSAYINLLKASFRNH
ncbi:hypothetical protein B6U80_01550 [Candidatus Pacearchaeota archaeon ex4484_26]|nr:MAG: hypothetical protein B6U80_01550 [Candidatus Pacearchaeota archaeon ex4484_26]